MVWPCGIERRFDPSGLRPQGDPSNLTEMLNMMARAEGFSPDSPPLQRFSQ